MKHKPPTTLTDDPLLIRMENEHAKLSRLIRRLRSGECWTRDQPGRATNEEMDAQIEVVSRAIAELEKSMSMRDTGQPTCNDAVSF